MRMVFYLNLHIDFMSAFGQDEPMPDKVAEASKKVLVSVFILPTNAGFNG